MRTVGFLAIPKCLVIPDQAKGQQLLRPRYSPGKKAATCKENRSQATPFEFPHGRAMLAVSHWSRCGSSPESKGRGGAGGRWAGRGDVAFSSHRGRASPVPRAGTFNPVTGEEGLPRNKNPSQLKSLTLLNH